MEAVKSPISTQNVFSVWGMWKHGVPQGSILGPLLFRTYIKDFPLRINAVSEPILFADDTSVIISSRFFKDLYALSSLVLSCMIKWFTANNLVLKLDRKNI